MNVKIDPKTTGAFILQLRKEHGLTQKQLADQLGITDKAISRWETGKGYPDIEMLVSIGEVFSVSVNELLCGERSVETQTAEKAVAGAYIDNTVKKHRLSVAAIIMGAFILVGAVIVLLVVTAVVSSGVGSFFTTLKGSHDCVIAHDYSYMTLFGERYVPIEIEDNVEVKIGNILISEAQVQFAPAPLKLVFSDSIYAVKDIPNNEIVYLRTDYFFIDTHYYCLESQWEVYQEQLSKREYDYVVACFPTDGEEKEIELNDSLLTMLENIHDHPSDSIMCAWSGRDRTFVIRAKQQYDWFHKEMGYLYYLNGKYYFCDHASHDPVNGKEVMAYEVDDAYYKELDKLFWGLNVSNP